MIWLAIWTIIQALFIFFLLYAVHKLISENDNLDRDLNIAKMNERCNEYLANRYLVQLDHSIPRCGMCGRLIGRDKKQLRNNIPYCPDCYRTVLGDKT